MTKNIDKHLDQIFDDFDNYFILGNFAAVDQILFDTKPELLNITVALGMVCAAFPARSRLQYYELFRERCRACFGVRADSLLKGL